ncbi:MAG TPA: cytochrome o ubiquinol oxidase subunit IV [Candidatus Binatia bacterium]|nr:cytochrome o ubiquinol oxidase subunit IV [Candidatus Binatia bacterium]
MKTSEQQVVFASHKDGHNYSLHSYVVGFVLSITLTLTAFLLVQGHEFGRRILIAGVAALALAQFVVQMLFFLHLGKENKPRYRLLIMCFMVLVVLILVFGSLWIMYSLNYRMTPEQINNYLQNQQSGGI